MRETWAKHVLGQMRARACMFVRARIALRQPSLFEEASREAVVKAMQKITTKTWKPALRDQCNDAPRSHLTGGTEVCNFHFTILRNILISVEISVQALAVWSMDGFEFQREMITKWEIGKAK